MKQSSLPVFLLCILVYSLKKRRTASRNVEFHLVQQLFYLQFKENIRERTFAFNYEDSPAHRHQ